MKRFFKPIEKDSSNKKANLSQDSVNGETETAEEEDKGKREPLKFVTWNANSLLLRVKNNWPEFTKFVTDIDPDVIAIQVGFSQYPSFVPLSIECVGVSLLEGFILLMNVSIVNLHFVLSIYRQSHRSQQR